MPLLLKYECSDEPSETATWRFTRLCTVSARRPLFAVIGFQMAPGNLAMGHLPFMIEGAGVGAAAGGEHAFAAVSAEHSLMRKMRSFERVTHSAETIRGASFPGVPGDPSLPEGPRHASPVSHTARTAWSTASAVGGRPLAPSVPGVPTQRGSVLHQVEKPSKSCACVIRGASSPSSPRHSFSPHQTSNADRICSRVGATGITGTGVDP